MSSKSYTKSNLEQFLEKIEDFKSSYFTINGDKVKDVYNSDGSSRKDEITSINNDILLKIKNSRIVGADVIGEVCVFLQKIHDVQINLYYGKNQHGFEVEYNSALSQLRSIAQNFNDYIIQLSGRVTEFGGYYEKISLLVSIESSLLILDGRFEKEDFKGYKYTQKEELSEVYNKIKYILNDLKINDKSKYWILLSYKILESAESAFISYANTQTLYDSEYINEVTNFYSYIVDPSRYTINRASWNVDEFHDASYKLEQALRVSALGRLLDTKIMQLNNFYLLENEVLNKHKNGINEFATALDEIRNLVTQSKTHLDEIQLEKSAVLQYSERLKNTPSIQVYTNIHSDEIFIANLFRWCALGIFGIFAAISFICLLVLFFGDTNNYVLANLVDTKKILAKIPFILAFILFGFYLAREGEKHRMIAIQAKQTEAELTALDSYTNGWDPQEIKELKIKLADKYFGRDVSTTHANSNNNIVVEQMKAGTELVKASTDVIKTFNPPVKQVVGSGGGGTPG
ncbi:hypothetical protein [Acinetobacter dispersus]|uniref:hypothetical protein n=1 Tax=Acinetobacter dispersus TaxID=70348 RepID=UPI00132EE416|nr:hypothetical protein [Acinetobacter dispersus]QHH99218.1 hypothetical protein FPL17_17390 [Acinetobacter dispersus]